MTAADEAPPPDAVLQRLRTATAADHTRVETALDLLDPDLTVARLRDTVGRLHAFWVAAERGLDAWAAREPHEAAAIGWHRRRRAGLFAADLTALGGRGAAPAPGLPPVADTAGALGRLYVLEGSTLGGRIIDRHLATVPALTGVRVRAFSPYGHDTGRMWHAVRAAVRQHAAEHGSAERMVAAAVDTFAGLAAWCSAGDEAVPA